MQLSKVDIHYDTVNSFLMKQIRDGLSLTIDELKKLGFILPIFNDLTCYKDENICKSDTCRFAGNPDPWVKCKGHDNLCDLVYAYIEDGPNFKAPKRDVMSGGGHILPGNGFSRQ